MQPFVNPFSEFIGPFDILKIDPFRLRSLCCCCKP